MKQEIARWCPGGGLLSSARRIHTLTANSLGGELPYLLLYQLICEALDIKAGAFSLARPS